MSQSNYNIPNDSAPAVRAQLNSVFGSIATNNSGTSAPSTTFAHQWWYDSTNNILKQRNAADSAWIDIGTFDQTGGTFTPSGVPELTQVQAEDGASTVFGLVSGQRLSQQTNAAFNVTGSAPKYACRAWVNFDGVTTATVRASGNVSSVTRNGTGQYTVNLTTAMQDANYATAVGFNNNTTSGSFSTLRHGASAWPINTTSCGVTSYIQPSVGYVDLSQLCVSIFR